MENLPTWGILLISYIIGSIPVGFIFVKIKTGQDIRDVKSGRTGGTNAGRAAGLWVGVITGVLDVFKGTVSVMLAKTYAEDLPWIAVFAALAAIIGHNHSIFLIQRLPSGKIRLGGGAGGGTSFGGAIGLWGGSAFIILPISALVFYFIGYASLTTMSVGVIATIIFSVRAYLGDSPTEYIYFGLLAELLFLYALRPNIKALIAGTERLHGYRARKKKKQQEQ